ncbi:MAG: hypothetical protein BGO08_04630 [Altererythrobacter sp. 66-12]|nr:MAG: hypothetical protein BGO08_04630 [Altererythrobacter sp. 66-12]
MIEEGKASHAAAGSEIGVHQCRRVQIDRPCRQRLLNYNRFRPLRENLSDFRHFIVAARSRFRSVEQVWRKGQHARRLRPHQYIEIAWKTPYEQAVVRGFLLKVRDETFGFGAGFGTMHDVQFA